MRQSIFLASVLVLVLTATIVVAEVPRVINYQGILLGSNEQPVPEDHYKITFRIYLEDGKELWSEVHEPLFIGGGMIHVHLGTINPLNLPFDQPYFLGIQVGNEPELQPRVLLTSAAFAFRADDADRLSGYTLSPTPQPNTLLPLDHNGKFPPSVLAGGGSVSGEFLRKNTPDTSRATSGSPLLLISNLGTGFGISGRSKDGAGVEGRSDNANGVTGWSGANDQAGVFGSSTNGRGVVGRSDKNDGVVGYTGAADKSGVFGHTNASDGYGITGLNSVMGSVGHLGGGHAVIGRSTSALHGYTAVILNPPAD